MLRGTISDGDGPYDNFVDECYEIVPDFNSGRGDSLWLRYFALFHTDAVSLTVLRAFFSENDFLIGRVLSIYLLNETS